MKITEVFARLTLAALLTFSVACGGPGDGELDDSNDASEEGALTQVGPAVPTVMDPCRTMAADNTQSLDAGDNEDQANSRDATYGGKAGCPRFIVDFNVLTSASPTAHHGPNFTADGYVPNLLLLSKNNCENTRVSVRRYRKTPSGSLTLVSTATYEGKYYPAPSSDSFNTCMAILTSGEEASDFRASRYGTQTFRIAVRATRSGEVIPVEASIRFQSIPS